MRRGQSRSGGGAETGGQASPSRLHIQAEAMHAAAVTSTHTLTIAEKFREKKTLRKNPGLQLNTEKSNCVISET